MTGAISALVRDAMARAIATGAMMSAPLAVTPCGSSVPSGTSTVSTRFGTTSRNSIQLMRSSSRVVGACAAAALAEQHQRRQRDDDRTKRSWSLQGTAVV